MTSGVIMAEEAFKYQIKQLLFSFIQHLNEAFACVTVVFPQRVCT